VNQELPLLMKVGGNLISSAHS